MATTISTDSPKLTADVASRAEVYGGRGLVFDGVADYLDCGNLTSTTRSNMTISFWFYRNVSGTIHICSRDDESSNRNWSIYIYDNLINFDCNISNVGKNTVGATAIPVGSWTHLAFTHNGSNQAWYVNGKLDGTSSHSGTIDNDSVNMYIGRRAGNYLNGSISDFKVYSSALTEAEVQSQYLKPESVPSPSTLVAWYPMSEANPESPQSIVYDHSEKKLGDSIASSLTWNNNSYEIFTTSGNSITEADNSSGHGICYSSAFSVTAGKTYKITFNFTLNSGSFSGGVVRIGTATSMSSSNDTLVTSPPNGLQTYYYSPSSSSSSFLIGLRLDSGSFNFSVSDLSIQEVLMGNHATTNFFGDELITTTANRDMTSDTGFWSDGTAVTYDATNDEWDVFSNSGGDYDIISTSALSTVSGKSYQFSFEIKNYTSGTVIVGFGSSYSSGFTGDGVKTGTVVANANGSFRIRSSGAASTNQQYSIDNVSVKEVGISSTGFTTAQNEPVIPQIPLVKYNEKMVFKGTSGQYVDVDIDSMNLGDFTISFWYNTNNSEGTFIGRGTSSCIRFSTNTTTFRVGYSNNYYINATTGSEIVNGRFLTATREGTSFKLYIDGVLDSTTTVATDAWTFGNTARIGQSGWGNFEGTIHECSVFNTALDSTQIQELFNDGVALDATTHSKASALKAYWRNDGITTWKNRADNFASFDGVNDVIARNAINVDYKSVSFWVKPTSTITKSTPVVRVGTFTGNQYSSIGLGSMSGSLTDELIGIYNPGTSAWENAGSASIPNDSWTHIAFVWDGSKYQIYYNGEPQTTTTSDSHTTLQSNQPIRIGAGGTATSFFDGDITGFAIWNKSLTDAQMLSVYNFGHTGNIASIQSSDLELYYTFNPYASTDPDTNSTVQDRSGNDNDSTSITGAVIDKTGTVAGSPDSITIREGLNSNKDGLGFPLTNPTSNIVRFSRNGLAEHLSIPITKAFDIQGSFTVEFWMKQPDMGSGYQQIINRDDTSNRNWSVQSINGQISLGYYSGGSFSNTQTSGTYDDDKWHHVCAILTSGTSVQIYVDTVLVKLNTSSIPTTIDNDPAVLNIGKRTGTTQFFIGSLDEVRFYNKALTAFEADGSAPEEGETATSGEVVKNYKHGKGKHKND